MLISKCNGNKIMTLSAFRMKFHRKLRLEVRLHNNSESREHFCFFPKSYQVAFLMQQKWRTIKQSNYGNDPATEKEHAAVGLRQMGLGLSNTGAQEIYGCVVCSSNCDSLCLLCSSAARLMAVARFLCYH